SKPQRILDFGCGPGTAAAAVYDVWGPLSGLPGNGSKSAKAEKFEKSEKSEKWYENSKHEKGEKGEEGEAEEEAPLMRDVKYVGVDISQPMREAAALMTKGLCKDSAFYATSTELVKRVQQT
ncbi:hypothetical protein B484DRAFT_440764, partial [Ochromonadaceae sp. CCMP2298]